MQGPGDGFNIRRAWLQKKRRACSDPAPSLTGPGASRKVVSLLSTSSRWDAECLCCGCSCGWSGVSGCPQQGQLQPRWAVLCLGSGPGVGSLTSWPLMGKVWSPVRRSWELSQGFTTGGGGSPGRRPPGPPVPGRTRRQSGYSEQSLTLCQMGVGRTAWQLYMGSNSSTCAFSKYLLSCYRTGTDLVCVCVEGAVTIVKKSSSSRNSEPGN